MQHGKTVFCIPILCSFFFLSLFVVSCASVDEVKEIDLIPCPAHLQLEAGHFKADENTVLYLPGEAQEYRLLAQMFNANQASYTGRELPLVFDLPDGNAVCFRLDSVAFAGRPEAYRLDITDSGATVRAGTNAGLFYGLQTMLQLLTSRGLPCLSVQDEPRFSYRGLHLDVSRNFFPKAFILKLIDLMAFYKLNIFHWHLTDGAGWRIQLDSYPRLTSETAFRSQADWKTWWNGDRKFVSEGTPGAYGGYYTKNDVREIVAYAGAKHIRVIPEIEMPAHSEEVFVAYPALCCSGKPYSGSDFCVGNEETFVFLENILTEIMSLFPSEYIHIGGDEAEKKAWKTCPACRQRMKTEKLANVDELQSYMIRRIGKFLARHDRKLIGWDEIMQGGLPPGATVMVWRERERAVEAARAGHDVVMTPGSCLYFDAYQADPKTQPEAIGGFTPVKRVYGYSPVPEELIAGETGRILGVQANVWSEYIPDCRHAEYMIFPRLLALAEVAWSPEQTRDWNSFKPRLNRQVGWLQAMDVNAFPLSAEIEVAMEVDTLKEEIRLLLDTEKYPAEIRYTTDGSTPTAGAAVYETPVVVKDSVRLQAVVFENGRPAAAPTLKKADYHRGIGKKIHYNNRLYPGYMAGGTNALLDGYRGGPTYLDGRWQGYLDHLDAVVDMEDTTEVHAVSACFMQLAGPGVFLPGRVELSVSTDGIDFTPCQSIAIGVSPHYRELLLQEYTFRGSWRARYIRLKAVRVQSGFLFTDEIVIW